MNFTDLLGDFYMLKVKQFCLVFFRVAGIMATAPVFAQKEMPRRIKAAVAFFISITLFPIVAIRPSAVAADWGLFTIQIGAEIAVGIIIGYALSLLFAGIQLGGEIVGRQMGFGLARVFDPLTRRQTSPITQLQGLVATLLFLAVNGHHWLLMALSRSFSIVPPGNVSLNSAMSDRIVDMVGGVFSMAVKIAAPAFVLLLLTTILMGVVARAVPQMNILIVGMPLKIALGLIGLIITVPVFGYMFNKFFAMVQKDVIFILHEM